MRRDFLDSTRVHLQVLFTSFVPTQCRIIIYVWCLHIRVQLSLFEKFPNSTIIYKPPSYLSYNFFNSASYTEHILKIKFCCEITLILNVSHIIHLIFISFPIHSCLAYHFIPYDFCLIFWVQNNKASVACPRVSLDSIWLSYDLMSK